MTQRQGKPGISRDERLSDEGLQRLEKQLQSGARINAMVLRQWIRRYGEAAERVMERYGAHPDNKK